MQIALNSDKYVKEDNFLFEFRINDLRKNIIIAGKYCIATLDLLLLTRALSQINSSDDGQFSFTSRRDLFIDTISCS